MSFLSFEQVCPHTVNAVHGINLKCTNEAKGQPTILVSCYKLNHAICIVFQRDVIQNMASTEDDLFEFALLAF